MNSIRKLRSAILLGSILVAPALAHADSYGIDPTHTFANFSYNHFGLTTQISKFNRSSGTVNYDPAARTGAVDISIDMTSVDTGYETFNEHLQGEDFFDTANHPTASFKSSKLNFDGDRPVSVDGELTIKGITKPVTLHITHFVHQPHPMLQKDAIGANATTVIKRSDFNADKYAPNVGDEVSISVSLEAIRN